MISCPGLLSPQEYNKGAPGWFVLISAIAPQVPREVVLFGPTLAVHYCHLCTPLGAVGGNLGL